MNEHFCIIPLSHSMSILHKSPSLNVLPLILQTPSDQLIDILCCLLNIIRFHCLHTLSRRKHSLSGKCDNNSSHKSSQKRSNESLFRIILLLMRDNWQNLCDESITLRDRMM